jgi:hypothetical protein
MAKDDTGPWAMSASSNSNMASRRAIIPCW